MVTARLSPHPDGIYALGGGDDESSDEAVNVGFAEAPRVPGLPAGAGHGLNRWRTPDPMQ